MLINTFSSLVILSIVGSLFILFVYLFDKMDLTYRTRIANSVLLGLSYALFLSTQPSGAILLFSLTVIAYIGAIKMNKVTKVHRKKILIWTLAAFIVLPLLIFKYSGFISEQVFLLLSYFAIGEISSPAIRLVVPLGISFFTFQTLGYVFDVYHGKFSPAKDFFNFMLFVAFFPQIASGPISRADELLPQIRNNRPFSPDSVVEGFRLILWGFFLKAVFADQLALVVNPVFANYNEFSGATCFVASLCYSLQIYGDFAGYSLLAIGVGRIFGFHLPQNFNRPYFSVSVTEFWRRWHISLSRWLRDYIYIPLGGSRCSKKKNYRNILATFLVSGIWHGANWTFIIWGLIHGVVQAIEKFFNLGTTPSQRIVRIGRIILTFLIVNFAWIYFRSASIQDGSMYIKRILTSASGMDLEIGNSQLAVIMMTVVVVAGKEILNEYYPENLSKLMGCRVFRWSVYLSLLMFILLFGVLDAGQFIYVNF